MVGNYISIIPPLAKKWQHLKASDACRISGLAWDLFPIHRIRMTVLLARGVIMAHKKTKKQKIAALKKQKNGLYRNVQLKRLGAGSKKKAKGYKPPTAKDFARSAKTAKKKKK